MLTRRSLISILAAALPGCRPKRGSGFPGYAFVANQEGRTVAVVDLTAFALVRHIPLEAGPTAISADPVRKTVHVLTPDNGTVHEIDPVQLAVRRKLRVAQRAVSMRTLPDGSAIWILCLEPRQLVKVRLDSFQIQMRVALPAEPGRFRSQPGRAIWSGQPGAQGSAPSWIAGRQRVPAGSSRQERGPCVFDRRGRTAGGGSRPAGRRHAGGGDGESDRRSARGGQTRELLLQIGRRRDCS